MDLVLAYGVADAQGVHADLSRRALARLAVAAVDDVAVGVASGGFDNAVAERDGCPAGGVGFEAMMRFNDLNVIAIAEGRGDLPPTVLTRSTRQGYCELTSSGCRVATG